MEKKILDLLETEVDKLEVQIIVSETLIGIINNLKISGQEAEMYAQQKRIIESSHELNKLLIAELKNKLKSQ